MVWQNSVKLQIFQDITIDFVSLKTANWVGGGVASSVLPHHRTYGSVYGGSSEPHRSYICQSFLSQVEYIRILPSCKPTGLPMFLNEAQESPFLEETVGYSSMHMGGSSIVPRSSTTCHRFLRPSCLNTKLNHFLISGLWLFPLPPQ